RLRDEGYYVISIDQRGFGESSGTVRVMSPDYEGQSLIALLDWAESLPGLARFADNKMVVGSYGGSYGGMYQYLLAAADPQERLRVIAPDITPYDLSYSLSSHNVPKSFWAAGLAAMGELSPDRKSTRLNSSHVSISYAVFCLKKKNNYVLKLLIMI